jgi:2-dehydropantoate 2-reductase
MRILVVGAGSLGGYFGACLARAGRDVTFLVRQTRAEQLARNGLRVVSPHGDFAVDSTTVLAGELHEPFNLILVGVKAYSLNEAMDQFAPAVARETIILPILNGIAHLDTLSNRFGRVHVLGGMAYISARLDASGDIVLMNTNHNLSYGELSGGFSDRTRAVSGLFEGCGFNAKASDAIVQDMWEKLTAIGASAGFSCLMRSTISIALGVPGGRDVMLRLIGECSAVCAAQGFPPRPAFAASVITLLADGGIGDKASSSMFLDIARGAPTEGEHILGDLTARARRLGVETPTLDLARIHVATYEAGRARSAVATASYACLNRPRD